MDINNEFIFALDELELLVSDVHNIDLIKKQYYMLALKWHPDKNKHEEACEKFKKINNAYTYLMELNNNYNDNSNTNTEFVSSTSLSNSEIYINILTMFISILLKGSYNEELVRIIKEIVSETSSVLTQAYISNLFEKIDKQTAIDLHNLLHKYSNILYINKDILELVSLIVLEKIEKAKTNDRVFILKPCIKDILSNNIYKLYVDGELYLVPLWHNELYFDAPDGSEILVLCQPNLSNELTIDENNNIYYEKRICIQDELVNLIKYDKFVSIELGGKLFSIPLSQLTLKEEQLYTIKKQGISRILEKDIYNVSYKGDIIVKIKLV